MLSPVNDTKARALWDPSQLEKNAQMRTVQLTGFLNRAGVAHALVTMSQCCHNLMRVTQKQQTDAQISSGAPLPD